VKNKKVIDVIFEQADAILNDDNIDPIDIRNKIILAMACRLKAEKIMWNEVSDKNPINSSQTGKLFQRYKEEFKDTNGKENIIRLLEKVNIITPENIHINSFMYEPILDMGIDELKKLYSDLSKLQEG
jgi:hypothetical protein